MVKSKDSGFSSGGSIGGKNVYASGGGGQIYVSKVPETRPDIRTLFIDELGFKELYGTSEIPTAQLASVAIELKKQEKLVHTLAKNDVVLSVTHKSGVKGSAADLGAGAMVIFLNPSYHTNVGHSLSVLQSEQETKYKTETNGKITKDFTYTARHEYGHLTQFSYMNSTGKSASQIRNEVQSIAKSKYNAGESAHPSGYGSTNEYEYFAESFASMTGGRPNAHGKALRDWIKKNS